MDMEASEPTPEKEHRADGQEESSDDKSSGLLQLCSAAERLKTSDAQFVAMANRAGHHAFVTKVKPWNNKRANSCQSISKGIRAMIKQGLIVFPGDPNEPLRLNNKDPLHKDVYEHPIYVYNAHVERSLVINMDPESSDAKESNGVDEAGIVKLTFDPITGAPLSGVVDLIFEVWPPNHELRPDEWATVRSKRRLRGEANVPIENSPTGPFLFADVVEAAAKIREMHYQRFYPAYLNGKRVFKRVYNATCFAPSNVKGTALEKSHVSLEQVRAYGYESKYFTKAANTNGILYPIATVPFSEPFFRQIQAAQRRRQNPKKIYARNQYNNGSGIKYNRQARERRPAIDDGAHMVSAKRRKLRDDNDDYDDGDDEWSTAGHSFSVKKEPGEDREAVLEAASNMPLDSLGATSAARVKVEPGESDCLAAARSSSEAAKPRRARKNQLRRRPSARHGVYTAGIFTSADDRFNEALDRAMVKPFMDRLVILQKCMIVAINAAQSGQQ